MSGITYVRDRIVLDNALRAEIEAELTFKNVAAGATLYFLAREIVHAPNYTFAMSGHPLVFVADSYDGKGGTIDTTDKAAVAKNGAAGAVGAPGGNGGNGAGAAPITLVAQKIVNARLTARGMVGGQGCNGARGDDGEDAEWLRNAANKPVCQVGQNGQNGGEKGGNGGKGGDGGTITVHYITKQGTLQLDGTPGPKGPAGTKGSDGKPGKDAGSCKGGKGGKGAAAGLAGLSGTPGKVTQTNPKIDDWWKLVVAIAGKSVSTQWGGYRTRVGEYRFRTYVPAAGALVNRQAPNSNLAFRPLKPANLADARREFESAVILNAKSNAEIPGSTSRAQVLLGHLNNGLTPIGIGYRHDLRPDFAFYEKFITDYQGQRDALFQKTLQLLLNVKDTSDKGNLAKAARDHSQGMAGAAQIDVTIAQNQRDAAEQAWDKAKGRLLGIQQGLIAVQQARKDAEAEISFGDVIKGIGLVVGTVIAIVGAAFSGGATAAAWFAAVSTLATTAAAAGEAAGEVGTWIDLSDPTDPKLTEAGNAVKGNLTDAIDKTAKLVDKVEAVAQLFAAQGDDQFDEKERQLLIDAFDAAYEVNMRFIDFGQTKLAVESAQQKWATYTADTLALDKLNAGFEVDVDAVAKVARILIRQFQTYVEYFVGYGFRRDRAFDLYTLADPPKAQRFRFDYGYLSPDLEENAFFALGRKDPARVLGLVTAYVKSLTLFDPATLREEYDEYWSKLAFEGHVAVSVTDPAVLQGLEGSGMASFDVPLAQFSPSTELKIGRAEIALIGAATVPDHNWVQVELEHCGDAENHRSNGTLVTVKAPVRRELSPAQVHGINPDDLDESEKQVFWGRSPAARWRVRIPANAATEAGLDLSGLTAIQLSVKYAYFNQVAAKKPGPRIPSRAVPTVTPRR
jgi:hypothetical protein